MRIISRATSVPADVSANVTTAQIFPNSADATKACVLALPGSGRFPQKRFLVRASGYITTNVTTNVTITLYSGTSLTAGSNTVLKASTARAQNSASAPWAVEGRLIYDTVSGKLHGTVELLVNNLLDAAAVVSNVVTGLVDAEPIMNLCVGVTFSAADAGNIASMKAGEFVVGF